MAGIVFGLAFAHALAERFHIDGQADIFHVLLGLVSYGHELLESGGAGPPQAVKLRLVVHGTGCTSVVAANHARDRIWLSLARGVRQIFLPNVVTCISDENDAEPSILPTRGKFVAHGNFRADRQRDRKSTRLNSSHLGISY